MLKIFKTATTLRKQIATRQVLSDADLALVSGGLNPQPLPPSHDPSPHTVRRA